LSAIALTGVFTLARVVKLNIWGQIVAGAVFLGTPAVLMQSSDYYIDMFLAGYLTMALVYIMKLSVLENRREKIICIVTGGTLLGFAAVSKKSGFLALTFPAMALVTTAIQCKQLSRKHIFCMAIMWLIALLICAKYLIKIPFFPRYPASDIPVSLVNYANAFFTVGLHHLFLRSTQLNAAVLIIFIGFLFLRATRTINMNSQYGFLPISIIAVWFFLVAVGIYHSGRIDYFNRWGRFILPIYGIVCVVVILYCSQLRTVCVKWRQLKKSRKLYIASFAIIVVMSINMMPIRTLVKNLVFRYGDISKTPSLGMERKKEKLYGDAYHAWKLVNELFSDNPSGKVLTEDNRFFYLEPLVYESLGVPEGTNSVDAMAKWVRDQRVKWIISAEKLHDFENSDENRDTCIKEFLQTKRLKKLQRMAPIKCLL